jgi:hypothetical protein
MKFRNLSGRASDWTSGTDDTDNGRFDNLCNLLVVKVPSALVDCSACAEEGCR